MGHNHKIEFHEESGLWWPEFEDRKQIHYEYHTRHLKDLNYLINACKRRRVVLQAGGNVGIWPNHLKKYFETVYSAEPDPALFACMEKNSPHVHCLQYAFGNEITEKKFFRTGKSGTGTLAPNDQEGDLDAFYVKQITIDSLGLVDLDAIQLDIEGYEEQAIKGARETLKRCRPMLQIETFDRTRDAITNLLRSYGYAQAARFGRDIVYEQA